MRRASIVMGLLAMGLGACTSPPPSADVKPGPTAAPKPEPPPAAELPAEPPPATKRPDEPPAAKLPAEPPPAGSPPVDRRWACAVDADCRVSCLHGAVARAWWEETYPGDEACEDGCSSKGTEAPVCREGACVARRMGADDPVCTKVDRAPLTDPGPAHRCTTADDCTNTCALGAINRHWLAMQSDFADCRDGCTSKGTEPARCEGGLCVAYRAGARNELCTRRSIWER